MLGLWLSPILTFSRGESRQKFSLFSRARHSRARRKGQFVSLNRRARSDAPYRLRSIPHSLFHGFGFLERGQFLLPLGGLVRAANLLIQLRQPLERFLEPGPGDLSDLFLS